MGLFSGDYGITDWQVPGGSMFITVTTPIYLSLLEPTEILLVGLKFPTQIFSSSLVDAKKISAEVLGKTLQY